MDPNFKPSSEDLDSVSRIVKAHNIDIELETQKMIDYYIGIGKAMKMWGSVWRNWIRNSIKYGGGNGKNRRYETASDKAKRSSQTLRDILAR